MANPLYKQLSRATAQIEAVKLIIVGFQETGNKQGEELAQKMLTEMIAARDAFVKKNNIKLD